MKKAGSLIALASLMTMGSVPATAQEIAPPKVGPDAIGGVVRSPSGAEAGVWVIAETADLGNRYIKIVVTDDHGRFVLPDLPKAKYTVWSRGYGLADSQPVEAAPGAAVALEPTLARNAAAAAQIYPANYWFSMIHVPPASEFPGTGPRGNGVSPAFGSQSEWIAHMVENCQFCHQLGTKATRELPHTDKPVEAWEQRIQKDRSPDDIFFEHDSRHRKRGYGVRMSNLMTQFGRRRGLEMFADWTSRIAKGETPPAPARPVGIERNIVITMRDIGGGRFLHDTVSTDRRDPTVNAGGPVYGTAQFSGMVVALDPRSGEQEEFKLTDAKGEYLKNANNHTPTMDARGRIWMTMMTAHGDNPSFCTDPDNKFANYFPRPANAGRPAAVFDPETKKSEVFPVCFGTHHLNFDKNERLYFSGDTEVVGWLDVETWDATKDPARAVGWCPLVLDTNGDGKITPDRAQWNERLAGVWGGEGADFREEDAGSSAEIDPRKDTRIAGFNYGIGVSPKDQTYWAAKYSPIFPSGILRLETGSNPPQTCRTEYYEAPKVNGQPLAYNARGVDVDAEGIAWVAFGSGAIGRFDRSKCKVRNGPMATGQHCPEGWEIIETPGPRYPGADVGADWFYLTVVDHHNTLGLGKGVPIFPNSVSDELLAWLPKEKRFVHLRVPYPLGFYPRTLDGRIDDEKAGWKGRGLWASNNVVPIWHQETGEGSSEVLAHFQLRPDPLAQ